MDLKETYNKIANDWVADHNTDTWWQEGAEYFLSLIPKESTILDVGCAGGTKTTFITDRGYKVTGIDFSEEMITIARQQYSNSTFEVLDMYNLDSMSQTFDGVFVQASLLHIPKDRVMEVLTKMKDRLNDGGLLYVAVKGMRGDVEEEIKTENDYGYDYQRFFSYFSLEELKRYFTDLGLEIVWEGNKTSLDTRWLQIIGRKKE